MSKNAEGWIRHRAGRKCPVVAGVKVDYRMRSKKEAYGERSELLDWGLDTECPESDIMAYRLHKPAEQPAPEIKVTHIDHEAGVIHAESVSSSCGPVKAEWSEIQDSGPLQWRDRIAEIDATSLALTTERAELVQKLASEGFALIGRVVEPVEDYGSIEIGDLVSVISTGGFSSCVDISVGDVVEVTSVDNDESIKTVRGGSWGSIGYNYKFHSRPSA